MKTLLILSAVLAAATASFYIGPQPMQYRLVQQQPLMMPFRPMYHNMMPPTGYHSGPMMATGRMATYGNAGQLPMPARSHMTSGYLSGGSFGMGQPLPVMRGGTSMSSMSTGTIGMGPPALPPLQGSASLSGFGTSRSVGMLPPATTSTLYSNGAQGLSGSLVPRRGAGTMVDGFGPAVGGMTSMTGGYLEQPMAGSLSYGGQGDYMFEGPGMYRDQGSMYYNDIYPRGSAFGSRDFDDDMFRSMGPIEGLGTSRSFGMMDRSFDGSMGLMDGGFGTSRLPTANGGILPNAATGTFSSMSTGGVVPGIAGANNRLSNAVSSVSSGLRNTASTLSADIPGVGKKK